jgi:hypothetical protein
MKVFQILLKALLNVAIVLSTCGVFTFLMYVFFSRSHDHEYQTLLAIFAVVDVCAIILLAGLLRMITAASAAVAGGALFHLVAYTLNSNWAPSFSPMFNLSATADAIVIMVMTTVAFLSARSRRRASTITPARETRSDAPIRKTGRFWSSLDQASKVSIITSLITAIAGIVTALIARSR